MFLGAVNRLRRPTTPEIFFAAAAGVGQSFHKFAGFVKALNISLHT